MNTQTSRKPASLKSLEHEMIVAGILWAFFGALCVIAVNAWA